MCQGLAMLVIAVAATQSTLASPGAMVYSVAGLALIGPISMQRVTQHLATWPGSNRLGGQGIVLTALILQFVALASAVPRTFFP
jgi:hypothetical protein